MKKYNVLIYPCSADNAIELYESLKYSLHLNLFGANSKKGIADVIFENEVIYLPNIADREFIGSLNEVVKDYSIDFVFPTHDDVIYYLSQRTNEILTIIIGANEYLNKICRFKSKTYALFANYDFCPVTYNSASEILSLPVFSKPDVGHGSIGALKIDNQRLLNTISFEENVVTEFLPGAEYTVDCYCDYKNRLHYAYPRKREEIRNGVSHFNTEPSPQIEKKAFEIGEKINEKLNFRGLWFFQLKEDGQGNLKLLEISPRIATTMAFARYKGVNLPLLTIFAFLDIEVKIKIVNQKVKLYRYSSTKAQFDFEYNNVYIDFDDTLIVKDKICIDAIAFIYQCKNKGIKVHLITKHQYDIYDSLKKYKISPELFEDIFLLPMEECKYKIISEPNSIFIDNHYKERNEVLENKGIPVFDVDGIKSLIKSL